MVSGLSVDDWVNDCRFAPIFNELLLMVETVTVQS